MKIEDVLEEEGKQEQNKSFREKYRMFKRGWY